MVILGPLALCAMIRNLRWIVNNGHNGCRWLLKLPGFIDTIVIRSGFIVPVAHQNQDLRCDDTSAAGSSGRNVAPWRQVHSFFRCRVANAVSQLFSAMLFGVRPLDLPTWILVS